MNSQIHISAPAGSKPDVSAGRTPFSFGALLRRPETGSFIGLVAVFVFFSIFGGETFLSAGGAASWLNIAAELEKDMQHVVDTYACEWKNAVTDPATRQRFRHFVNSDQADQNVVFMPERGQIRPATIEERKRVIPLVVKSA